MDWWQIALIVYGLGIIAIWLLIAREMTKPGAQSQHGGELVGCGAALAWPALLIGYLVISFRTKCSRDNCRAWQPFRTGKTCTKCGRLVI